MVRVSFAVEDPTHSASNGNRSAIIYIAGRLKSTLLSVRSTRSINLRFGSWNN